jgi:hypothetical protein
VHEQTTTLAKAAGFAIIRGIGAEQELCQPGGKHVLAQAFRAGEQQRMGQMLAIAQEGGRLQFVPRM